MFYGVCDRMGSAFFFYGIMGVRKQMLEVHAAANWTEIHKRKGNSLQGMGKKHGSLKKKLPNNDHQQKYSHSFFPTQALGPERVGLLETVLQAALQM